MAFWGVEVKPGKPFTHSVDRLRGRLRISQATLGIGSATKKSIVQCNVGNKSPVFLCALLPDKTESCHLDLEFEEVDEVVISVIGPRSVYLTGYYLGSGRHSNFNDDSESYGEDIANTDTDVSNHCSKEDEYEDSFIDDGELEVFPPSPMSNGNVSDEEMLDQKKLTVRRLVRKRLKKKYQSVVSDDDNSSQPKIVVNDNKGESDDDNFPISSLHKSRTTEAEEKCGAKMGKSIGKKAEDDANHKIEASDKADASVIDTEPDRVSYQPGHSILPSNDMGLKKLTREKRKRKKMMTEGKTLEDDSASYGISLENDKNLQYTAVEQKPAIDKLGGSLLPSAEASLENDAKPRKRRKKGATKGAPVESDADRNQVFKYERSNENEGDDGRTDKDLSMKSKDGKLHFDKNIDMDYCQVNCQNHSKNKKTKKKKNSNLKENEETVITGLSPVLHEVKNKSTKDKNVEAKSSHARSLSNGLTIEELEVGKPDGKVAALGKKVKVYYTGKLKEGQIFDSNIGQATFKFRLGDEDIIQGWNVGLDGMLVGGKRRLIIPPSMGYGSQGAGENVPPNSWLVYEVELVGVR